MLYLLDTNIISDMMRNPAGRAAQGARKRGRLDGTVGIVTSVVVQCELLYGLRRAGSARWQHQYRATLDSMDVLPLDTDAAAAYASLRTQLESAGTPIGPMDTLIAAHALALDATLVSADSEFARVPGLKLENWLQPAEQSASFPSP